MSKLNNSINNLMTPWIAYTPTFTGFGTPTSVSFYSRRVGDCIQIKGSFVAGTTTATKAEITLGYNGSNNNITSNSSIINSICVVGTSAQSFSGSTFVYPLCESGGVGFLTFGTQTASASALTEVNGSTLMSSGQTLTIWAEVPVTTWP